MRSHRRSFLGVHYTAAAGTPPYRLSRDAALLAAILGSQNSREHVATALRALQRPEDAAKPSAAGRWWLAATVGVAATALALLRCARASY